MGTETGELVTETNLGLWIILAEAMEILGVLRGIEAILGVLRGKTEAKVTSLRSNVLDVIIGNIPTETLAGSLNGEWSEHRSTFIA